MFNETQIDRSLIGTQRVTAEVKSWHNGRTPADGECDEVSSVSIYYEADGSIITDQTRIAVIEVVQNRQEAMRNATQ